jgi:hypothetical protein
MTLGFAGRGANVFVLSMIVVACGPGDSLISMEEEIISTSQEVRDISCTRPSFCYDCGFDFDDGYTCGFGFSLSCDSARAANVHVETLRYRYQSGRVVDRERMTVLEFLEACR